MDPTANLARQLVLAEEIVRLMSRDMSKRGPRSDLSYWADVAERADELATLVAALNEWITHGGALPAHWKR